MAAAAISERRSQLLGSGKILQTIYLQFQFEGQTFDRFHEGWNSVAMNRNRGASFLTAQKEFAYGTGAKDARF